MKNKTFGLVAARVVGVLILLAVFALPIQMLWNAIVPDKLEASYLQSFYALLLLKMLWAIIVTPVSQGK